MVRLEEYVGHPPDSSTAESNPRWSAQRVIVVTVVGLVAFALSPVWYAVFGEIVAESSKGEVGVPQPWVFAIAPLREILSATVLAHLIDHVRPRGWKAALRLGLVLWLGFYVVQLAGAVIFENMPPLLGAVHAGDWLMKLLVMTSALSAWQGKSWPSRSVPEVRP